jgi:hypothetical protein
MKKINEDRIGFDDINDDPFSGFGNHYNNDYDNFDDDPLDSFEDIDDINTEEELKHLRYIQKYYVFLYF